MTLEADFEAFRLAVLEDESLQFQLRKFSEKAHFMQQVVALGAAHGYVFTIATVEAALQHNRRAWIERWIR